MVRAILQSLFSKPIERPGADAHGALRRRWDVTGPLAAPEAYDLVERLAVALDAGCVLSRVERLAEADEKGRSIHWRLAFRLPAAGGRVVYDVLALTEPDGEVRDGVEIEMRVEAAQSQPVRRAALASGGGMGGTSAAMPWR